MTVHNGWLKTNHDTSAADKTKNHASKITTAAQYTALTHKQAMHIAGVRASGVQKDCDEEDAMATVSYDQAVRVDEQVTAAVRML